ncbi:MAG: acyltransferase family protein [Beijerinckiaceae bacterium]|nr:acyltransferase family protein [Beijerinckiaceae bacterium]
MHKMIHTNYRPEIAGLRAFAVISVVLYHAFPALIPGGFIGVDVFFVISGYLITRIILTDLNLNKFSIVDFYTRRIKRILPALIIVLAAVWVYGWFRLFPSHFRDLGRFQNISSFFYLNFMLVGDGDYFDVASQLKPLLHLWSLSIEEQFYIFWPILLAGIVKFNRRHFPVLMLVTLSSLSYCVYKTSINPTAAYYLPWSRAWELLLGGIVAWREINAPNLGRVSSRSITLAWSLIGLVLLFCSALFINENQLFPGWRATIPTLGTAIILAVPNSTFSSRFLGNKLARYVGEISYPLYLWHWPLLAFAHLEMGSEFSNVISLSLILGAMLLAIATNQLIELPINNAYANHRKLTSVTLFAGLVGMGLLGVITHDFAGIPSRFAPDVARILDFPNSAKPVTQKPSKTSQEASVDCFYNFRSVVDDFNFHAANIIKFYQDKPCFTVRDTYKPTIALVGDSHASHLFTGLKSELGDRFNIVKFDTFYCVPLIENVLVRNGRSGTERCRAYNQFVFKALRQLHPDIVLVGSYFLQYQYENDWYYPKYLDGVRHNSAELIKAGIKSVVIVGQVPIWKPSLKEVLAREVQSGVKPATFSMNGLNLDIFKIDDELKLVQWDEKVHYVSMLDELCNSEGCRRLKGNDIPDDLMAVDYGHFSAGGSIYIFQKVLTDSILSTLPN